MKEKRSNRLLISLLGVLLLLTVIPFTGFAAVPQTINYQGYLTDPGGVPVNSPPDAQMTFCIYDEETGVTTLWCETQDVTVSEGVYSVMLGTNTANPLNLPFDTQYYLGVEVETDGEMTPRQPLTSVPYALRSDEAGDADTVDGAHAAALEESAEIDADISTHASNASEHHAKTTNFTELTDTATDAQIPDNITVNYAATAGDADSLDGIDSTGFAASSHTHTGSLYSKVAIVAQSGGDYTSPLDAMSDLAAWCGTASSTNPCLVRIMPGIYDLGNNGLVMQAYVDIEGSGENTTTITSTHSSGSFDATSATVSGAGNAEIRFLTIENQGGSSNSLAIYNGSASPDITNVTAIGSGGSSNNYSVYNVSSSPEMTNVTATASGGTSSFGVYNYDSSPEMTNVTATASGGTSSFGVYNVSSSPEMTNVTATGSGGSSSNYGVYNNLSSPEMVDVSSNGVIITGNQLFVPASGSDTENGALLLAVSNEITGLGAASATKRYTLKLDAGTYDLGNNGLAMQSYVDIEGSGENTTTITSAHSSGSSGANSATVSGADNAEIRFLTIENQGGSTYSYAIYNGSASPDITNVTVIASGGSVSRGVFNSSSSPAMTNVTATASGGTYNYGVFNNNNSSPEMTNVTATASGGTYSYGVYNNNSSPAMTNVTATGSGGTSSFGMYNNNSSPEMTNVTITASGGSSNYGVYNSSSSPAMTNVTATASGGSSSNYGVYNASSSPEMVDVSSNGVIITGNQLFVPASGSDTENGALLLSVSNEIDGLGAASATNRYTIKLDAGTYDLGNNGLAMQSYVDIEGSGENTTTITSTHSSGSSDATSATVSGAGNAEIRFVTIENQGGSTYSFAIYNGSASPEITNVTATASGGTQYNEGVTNSSSSPTMTNVTATASGGTVSNGVSNSTSSPTLTNVTATASGGTLGNYGMTNASSYPTIKNSSISGWSSIYNFGVGTTKVGATMLGGPVAGSGFTCVGVYDASFTALDSSCN